MSADDRELGQYAVHRRRWGLVAERRDRMVRLACRLCGPGGDSGGGRAGSGKIVVAPLIGTLTGLAAGMYPALKAASIIPVEALAR